MEPGPRRGRPRADTARPAPGRGRGQPAPLRYGRDRRRCRDPPRGAGDPARRPAGDHRVRPAAGAVRGGPRRAAGGVAVRLRRRGIARHAGLAGGDHLGAGRGRGAGGAGVRPQRRIVPRAVDDRDGRRHQPLVPLRPDLPHVLHAHHAVRMPGRERRRLGALRRPGEGAAADRVPAGRVRAGLAEAAPAHDRHVVLLPAHRPVAVRELRRRRTGQPARPRPVPGPRVRRHARPGLADGLDALAPNLRPQPPRPSRRRGPGRPGRRRLRGRGAEGRPPGLRRRGPRQPGELPPGNDRLAGQPARIIRQGHGVLHAAPTRRRRRGSRPGDRGAAAPGRGALARDRAAGQAGPGHHHRLPDDQ